MVDAPKRERLLSVFVPGRNLRFLDATLERPHVNVAAPDFAALLTRESNDDAKRVDVDAHTGA